MRKWDRGRQWHTDWTLRCTATLVLTNVSSNVLKLGLVGDELLLGWNIDAHVAGVPDGRRSHPDVDLWKRKHKNDGYNLLNPFSEIISNYTIILKNNAKHMAVYAHLVWEHIFFDCLVVENTDAEFFFFYLNSSLKVILMFGVCKIAQNVIFYKMLL